MDKTLDRSSILLVSTTQDEEANASSFLYVKKHWFKQNF